MNTAIQKRVSKSVVDALQPGEMVRDLELKGFGVRRQNGPPVYFLQKRILGRLRWITIGTHGQPHTAITARKQALKLMGQIANGEDPSLVKKQIRSNPTVSEACGEFLSSHGPKLKPRTREAYERHFKLHISSALGSRKIADIKRGDISQLHAKMANMPSSANFSLAVISKLMNWAEETGLRPDHTNPCRHVKKFREHKSERYLTMEEFARLGAVLDRAARYFTETVYTVAALRLLILTGARKNEILTLKWEYVDFKRSLLKLPDSKTGAKSIKLNDDALGVLRNLPRIENNPYVIVGDKDQCHLIGLQKQWKRIRGLAGLEDVRIHDLRHSYASVIASSGGSLPLIGSLLGHRSVQTTARYAHLFDDPVRQLNDAAGEAISKAMNKSLKA